MQRRRDCSVWPLVIVLLGACSSEDDAQGDDADAGGSAIGGNHAAGGMGHAGGADGGMGGSTPVSSYNEGFIGGACESQTDCTFDGGECLGDDEGFPKGMCTRACDDVCPDVDGAVTTACVLDVAPDGEPTCTTICDYGISKTGCRSGYQCQARPRASEPSKMRYVCVPGEDDPFPLSACHLELLERGVAFTPAPSPDDIPEGAPGAVCTVKDPVWVTPYYDDVAYVPDDFDQEPSSIFAACNLALSLEESARLFHDLGVTKVLQWGTYNCRVVAGTDVLSEHGKANAIDIAGVELPSGQQYTVLDDWEKADTSPETEGGEILYQFARQSFDDGIFNIVLTPEYNEAHADHVHCDLTKGSSFFK